MDAIAPGRGGWRKLAGRAALTVSDGGTGAAALHVAADAAALAAHAAGLAGDSLRFHRFTPAVSIGRHQALEREARLDYCRGAGISLVQRVTAGGALYLDPGQQCFSLAIRKDGLGRNVAQRLEAGAALVADGLRSLGVEVEFKAPNDLQVRGRQKLASVFLAELGESALLFATVIVELDLRSAMRALLVPTEKLTVTGLEHARERMTSLAEVLGRVPSPQDIQAALTMAVARRLGSKIALREPTAPAAECRPLPEPWEAAGIFFETKDKVPGATLRALVAMADGESATRIRFATDGHVSPVTALDSLAAHLSGGRLADLAGRAATWLAANPPDTAGFAPADLVRLVERAAAKWSLQASLGLTPGQTSGLMLAGCGTDPAATLAKANVMLVPYCAKPNWCKWRHTIDCVECGECEVGDAYAMARERNMEVITITNFEHLADTLGKMRQAGVESYVGMCCGEFFLKRHHAFRDSGMDAVLLDIEGATCYELKEEHLAYAGAFKAEARLDADAVEKIMAKVPVHDAALRPCITGIARRPGETRHAEAQHAACGICACASTKRKA